MSTDVLAAQDASAGARPPGVIRICWTFVALSLRRWRSLLGLGATVSAESVLNIVKPWPIAILVDNVLGGHPLTGWRDSMFGALPGGTSQAALLNWVVVATVVVFALDWAVTLLGDYTRIGFGQRLVYDVAEKLFDHLQRLSLRFHSQRGVGDSIRRITSDSSCASTIVVDALLPVFAAVVTLTGMVLVMFRIDAELALVALTVLPVLAVLIGRYAQPMAQRGYDLEVAESAMYDHVERTLSGVLVVQAFNGEERAEGEMASATDDVLRGVLHRGAPRHERSPHYRRGHRLRFVPLLVVRPHRVAHLHVVDGAGCRRQCAPDHGGVGGGS